MVVAMLLLNLAATLYMTGVIWFVQLVHYPLFDGVGAAGFADYEARHGRWTTAVVMPPMLLELATAAWLACRPPAGAGRGVMVAGLVMVLALWAVTFFVSVPQHATLTAGFDARAHRTLVITNWIRTALWTVRGVLMLAVVQAVLRRGGGG